MMMPPTYLTVLGAKAVNSSDAAPTVDDDSFIRLGDDHITHLLWVVDAEEQREEREENEMRTVLSKAGGCFWIFAHITSKDGI